MEEKESTQSAMGTVWTAFLAPTCAAGKQQCGSAHLCVSLPGGLDSFLLLRLCGSQ
jgi:hypothetical protein